MERFSVKKYIKNGIQKIKIKIKKHSKGVLNVFAIALMVVGMTTWPVPTADATSHEPIENTSTNIKYSSLQTAIDDSENGHTITIDATTIVESSGVEVNKELTITGAGIDSTTIDVSAAPGYGIEVNTSNVVLKDFTLEGPNTSANSNYGIKVQRSGTATDNVDITRVKVQNSYRAGIDYNSVNGGELTDVESYNATKGNGIQLTASNDITIDGATTNGNAWGGIALYADPSYTNPGDVENPSLFNITTGEDNGLYKQEKSGKVVTNLTAPQYSHIVMNDQFRQPYSDSEEFTFYLMNKSNGISYAVSLPSSHRSVLKKLSTGDYIVGSGMKIQTAIEYAQNGDTVRVQDGTFTEDVTINKELLVRSANGPSMTTIAGAVDIESSNVALRGLEITQSGGIGVTVNNGPYDNVKIFYNEIHNIGTIGSSGDAAGIYLKEGSNITLRGNEIYNIAVLDGSGQSPEAILMSDGDGFTSVDIRENNIHDITGDSSSLYSGAFGVGVYENTTDLVVRNNTFSDIYGNGWSVGVALDADTPDARVKKNDFENITTSGGLLEPTAVSFNQSEGNDANPGSVDINLNNFYMPSSAYGVTYVGTSPASPLNAKKNYWNDQEGPSGPNGENDSNGALVTTDVTYSPWLCNPYMGESSPETTTDGSCEPASPTSPQVFLNHNMSGTPLVCTTSDDTIYTNTTDIIVDWESSVSSDVDYYWFGIDNPNNTNPYHKNSNDNPEEFTDNSTAYFVDITPGSNPYTYTIIAVDENGNESDALQTCEIVLDQEAPEAKITNPDNETVSGVVDVRGTIQDDNPSHYYLRIENSSGNVVYDNVYQDPSSFTDGSIYQWDTSGMNGEFTIYLETRDKANNKDGTRNNPGDSVDVVTVIVDNTAPVVEVTGPSDTSNVSGVVDIRGTVDDENPDHYFLRITQLSTGTEVYTSTFYGSPQDFEDLSIYSWDTTAEVDGDYSIFLSARDAVGNKDGNKNTDGDSVDSIVVTVDNTAPTVTVEDQATTDQTPTISGTVDEPANVEVTVDGNTYPATVSSSSNPSGLYEYEATIADTLSTGTYEVVAEATDAAGNTGTDGTNDELSVLEGGVGDAGDTGDSPETDEGGTGDGEILTPTDDFVAQGFAQGDTGTTDEGNDTENENGEEEIAASSTTTEDDGAVLGEQDTTEEDNQCSFWECYWWVVALILLGAGTYWYIRRRGNAPAIE